MVSGLARGRPPVRRTWAPRGETPVLIHAFNWAMLSLAVGLAFRWDFRRSGLFFQTRPGNYNDANRFHDRVVTTKALVKSSSSRRSSFSPQVRGTPETEHPTIEDGRPRPLPNRATPTFPLMGHDLLLTVLVLQFQGVRPETKHLLRKTKSRRLTPAAARHDGKNRRT